MAVVHPKPTGQIAERQRQGPTIDAVHDLAQQAAKDPHVRSASLDVTGCDQDFCFIPPPPHFFQEHRPVGQVCIHRDDVGSRASREAGKERPAIASFLLDHDAGFPPLRSLACPVTRSAVGDQNLRRHIELAEDFLDGREQQLQIVPLVQSRDHDRQIRSWTGRLGHNSALPA